MKYLITFLISILIISSSLNKANAVTFNEYNELSKCVDNHWTFTGYKKNLQKCYAQKKISISDELINQVEKKNDIIENVLSFDIPGSEEIKKPKKKLLDIFKKITKPKNISDGIKEDLDCFANTCTKKIPILENNDFSKLSEYIKKNPKDIYAITEDINILTYQQKLISEAKRQEILINVYNSFDFILLKPLPNLEKANALSTPSFGAGGAIGVLALAAAAGGGGGSGGGSAPTLSFAISSTSVGECDSNVTITANLTKAHSENVTVTYAVGGTATRDTDYALSSTTSTIVAGATSGAITLNPTNDTTVETSETVTLSASTSGVSTTGNTSTTITIHDYVLKCNTTAFSEGSASEQTTITNKTQWGNVDSDNDIHPYEQLNVHKAQSYKSGSTTLTGNGQFIHIVDSHCNDNHDIFNNKTIHNLDDGDAGESTFDAATNNALEHHCQTVATFAAGDATGSAGSGESTHMGVAPDADLILSSFSNVSGNSSDDYARDLDSARALNAVASNNSWGWKQGNGTSYNSAEFIVDRDNAGRTNDQAFANLYNGGTTSTDISDWQDYVTALDNFQNSGVIVWAAGNTEAETESGVAASLPTFYSELSEAWINVINADFTGSSMSNASESEFTRQGNACGSTKEFCVTVDGTDVGGGSWVNGSGVSQYDSDELGSSYSAPMVSGGVALLSQAFPNHTPEQITQRILASANNDWFTPSGVTTFTTHGASIKHGYNNEWGHGVPDFYAALSPITSSMNPGGFGFPSGSGGGGSGGGGGSVPFSQITKLAVSATGMKVSSSLGDGIMNGLKGKTAYAYDALNGGFKYDVNEFINYNALTEQKIGHTIDQEVSFLRNFRFSENKTAKDFNVYAGEYINFRDKYNRGLSVTLDQPNIALQNFNLYNNKDYKNPFTSENKGVGFNNKFYFFGNSVLLGYNNSKFNPLTSVNENLVVPMETLALSVNLDSDNFDLLSFTTGLIKEENTFLLSEGSGAFNLNDKDNLSNFYGFNFSKSLNSLGNIYLSTMFGNSKLDNAKNSLIVDTSNVLSSSFEVNYELKNLLSNDQLNISLSQPNRVEQGDMTFRFMGLADKNGVLPYQDHKVSLSPSGRQKDLTVSYYKNHSRNLKTGIKAVLTDDLGHVKNNSLNTNLLLSASYNF
jgi:subtilase-type serine protease